MKTKIIMLGAMLLLANACTDKFEELNTNPNQPTEVPSEYLLTFAQESLVDRLYEGFDNARVGMTLAQYWSQNQYTEESRFQYRPGTNNTTWDDFYTGINNLQEIIRLNEADEAGRNANQIAIARIMKAWAFQILTDTYGDIPYTEAVNAVGDIFAPAYTNQEEIYPNLLLELTEASNQLDDTQPSFASGDKIFDGDVTAWKKFANSLKLRVAMRMIDRLPAEAAAAIQEAVAAGVFTSSADNASLKYTAAQPNTNPLYVGVIVSNRNDFSSSDVFVDVLKQRNDPRLGAYFKPAAASGEFIGRPFGQNQAAANAQPPRLVSQLSNVVLAPDFEGMLMDYAEVSFILAEAAARQIPVGSDAATYYAQGIRASIEYWEGQRSRLNQTFTPANIDSYIAANPYDASNYKVSIGVQKWIALYMQGLQGWSEWRRLDFGILKMPVSGPLINISQIPVRRTYPSNEQTLNGANYQAAVGEAGADSYETKVWWDVN